MIKKHKNIDCFFVNGPHKFYNFAEDFRKFLKEIQIFVRKFDFFYVLRIVLTIKEHLLAIMYSIKTVNLNIKLTDFLVLVALIILHSVGITKIYQHYMHRNIQVKQTEP